MSRLLIPTLDKGDFDKARASVEYRWARNCVLFDKIRSYADRASYARLFAELGSNQLGNVRVSLQDEPSPNLARAFPLGASRDGFGLGLQVTGEHDYPGQRAPGSMSWAGITAHWPGRRCITARAE